MVTVPVEITSPGMPAMATIKVGDVALPSVKRIDVAYTVEMVPMVTVEMFGMDLKNLHIPAGVVVNIIALPGYELEEGRLPDGKKTYTTRQVRGSAR